MDRRTKKAMAEAEQLQSGVAMGDPEAMWRSALLQAGVHPVDKRLERSTSYLVDVTERMQAAGHAEAASLVARAAEAGHPQAQFVAAGLVERTDPERATELLERAAGQGETAAMLYLGLMLPPGPEATQWLTKVAQSGDPAGMYQLSLVLAASDPAAAQDWLRQAAEAGSTRAQNEFGVRAFEAGQPIDRAHPPTADPRKTGVFGPTAPTSRQDRVVADCLKCHTKTVQDHYELIVGRWFGVRGPSTAGKTGTRVHFSVCAICGCMFPIDDAARQYVATKGGEFFNPAKLHQSS